MGSAGQDATPTKITGSISCFGAIATTGLSFGYSAHQFSDGFVFVSADVSGAANQSSGALFFAPTQVGWATAPIVVTFDSCGTANAGWFKLSLNRTTLVVTIEYHDIGCVDDGAVWVMTPDKCVVNSY